jgi:Fur family transcriptional regulator, stress-responsive regulator
MTDQSSGSRLRAVGLRVTKQRIAVIELLDDAGAGHEHLTVAQIATRARNRLGKVSTQAVYDCLEALTETGVVRRIEPAGQPTLYETRVADNHHHLVCRDCGLTTDVDCAVGPAPCLTASNDAGFLIDEAEVIFWGRCPACASAPEMKKPQNAPSGTVEANSPRKAAR